MTSSNAAVHVPPRRPRARAATLVLALTPLVLARCGCDEEQKFVPGARYTPAPVLSFGEVAVTSQKTLYLRVDSNGSAGLVISQYSFPGANPTKLAKFRVERTPCAPDTPCTAIPEPLDAAPGLRPGATATIAVTYRPCPDAWNGEALKAGYDFSTCDTTADQVKMIILDNTVTQNTEISLAGDPAQPPSIELRCPPPGGSGMFCNNPNANLQPCVSLSFGDVQAGQDMPCDIYVEIRNNKVERRATGELNVERLDLRVANIDTPGNPVDGQTVGFSVLDEAGAPLTTPFAIAIPPGAEFGARKLRVRFDGSGAGIWRGEAQRNTGLRIYHDDPTAARQPFITASVSASGSAPDIEVFPAQINFGPVEQGRARTATITVSNAGNAPLRLDALRFDRDTAGAEFTARLESGTLPLTLEPFNNNTRRVFVTYRPQNSGQDADKLIIGSNDPSNARLEVNVSGGATPRIAVDPADTLVFQLPTPRPPPGESRERKVTIRNLGFGDLVVQTLSIGGPNPESYDDFSIRECPGGFPCTLNRTLCPPTNPGCTTSSTEITVVYRNNDNSTQDLAELTISSTDPANPTYLLTLSAEDNPCLAPTGIITVETMQPTEGAEVCVNCNASSAGGEIGGTGTIMSCEWSFAFATSTPLPALTPPTGNRACFTPTNFGVHILNVSVTNNCGARSQSPGTEVITVRARQ